jgi:UDP-N-acetylglucosamine 2-epimerase (non-hydrolysing)
MIALMASADRVVTDSGGIQKEAYMLKVPCKRKNTEWVETIESGWNVLAGASKKRLLETINK